MDEPALAIPAAAFPALLVARGLTVVNDNLLRWLAIGLGKRAAGAAGTALVLTIGTAGFVLPFVALAWLAGWLADRYPKRTVVVWCKVVEIIIVGAAAATMAWNTRPGGAFAGWTGTVPAAVALVGIAAAGWLASLRLAARPAADPHAPPPFNALGRTWGDLRDLFAVPELLASGLGIVFFWALGAVAQLNVDQYVAEAGATSQGQAVPMLLALVVGIGLGSVTAGRLSVGGVNLGLVPVGGLLMAVASLALALGPATIFTPDGIRPWAWGFALVLLGLLGFGAGMFDVPLEAHYQDRSPEQRRGGLLAGLNLLTFAGMMIASLLYGLLRTPTDQPPASLPPGLWLLLGTVILIGCQAALIAPAMIGSISESVPRTALSGANGVFALVSLAATLVGMAAGNFLSDASGAAAAAADGTVAAVPLVSARGVFGIFALLSVGAAAAAVWCAPRATLRMVVSTIVHAGYRFRVENTGAMPATGPVVVVANHVSWLDGFLVTLASPRPIRMVVYGPNIQGRFLRMLADQWRFILFDPRPKSIGTALKTMQAGLRDGDVVGIFSEGGIARTGQVLGFKRGLGWLLERVEAPIQPLSIDGLWGSRFSFSEGRFFGTKRSSRWRRPVTLTFGAPLPVGTPPEMARLALQELAASAVRRRLVAGTRGASGGANAGTLDDAALRATAEAFDGACLVKPRDVLVSSLAEADPLGRSFGPRAARLLGIRGDAIEPTDDAGHLASALQSQAATIWLASVAQVEALTTTPDTISLPAGLDAVVIPIVGPAAHGRAQAAAAAFQRRYRIEPVTALAVAGGQALVAMNTPAARVPAGHDVPLRPESLGRVVNGAVVWPETHQRAALGLPPVPGIAQNDSRCLVIGAMLPRSADGPPQAEPAALLLDDRLAIDADGFLVEGPV